jgi:hypothetical protein
MRQRRETMLPLDAIHNHQRFVAGAAARPIGDGAIIGLGLEQGGNLLFQKNAVPLAGFRREKLKGNDRPSGRVFRRVNVTDNLHLEGGLSAEAQRKPSFEMQVLWGAPRHRHRNAGFIRQQRAPVARLPDKSGVPRGAALCIGGSVLTTGLRLRST